MAPMPLYSSWAADHLPYEIHYKVIVPLLLRASSFVCSNLVRIICTLGHLSSHQHKESLCAAGANAVI